MFAARFDLDYDDKSATYQTVRKYFSNFILGMFIVMGFHNPYVFGWSQLSNST